jgi:hypothetical protein
MHHLTVNNLLDNNQFGFLSGRSTTELLHDCSCNIKLYADDVKLYNRCKDSKSL